MASSRPPRVRAYIGLGGNVGDAASALAAGVRAIEALPRVRLRAVSRLYATAPWGVVDQREFRNAVVVVETRLPPLELLAALKDMERAAGRSDGPRWGPRRLDLDLLVYGRHRITLERPPAARSLDADHDPERATRLLEVPHRDAGERLFVLAPLADLAPRLVPPGWHETVESARRRVAEREPAGSVRPVAHWDVMARGWAARQVIADVRPTRRRRTRRLSPSGAAGAPRGRRPR
jgi:2-amino-4-hydroxy-6-hydroxymethyldihydropteridine diphosphokinase